MARIFLRTYLLATLPLFLPITADKIAIYERATPTCTTTAINPPPTGFVCNMQGRVQQPSVLNKKPAVNETVCRDRCLTNQPACVSFAYGPGQRCRNYNKKIIDMGFQRMNTSQAFFNRNCFGKLCGQCSSGQTICSGQCVDTLNDSSNCGSCDNQCGDGASCTNGSCTCPTGSSLCSGPNGPCQDITSDDNNCGSCGNTCTDSTSCINGTCSCPAGQTQCTNYNGSKYCANLQNDFFNCGDCLHQCISGGGTCSAGVCSCPDDTEPCYSRANKQYCGDIHETMCGPCTTDCSTNSTIGSCSSQSPQQLQMNPGECCNPPERFSPYIAEDYYTYRLYFSGMGVRLNPNNPGNEDQTSYNTTFAYPQERVCDAVVDCTIYAVEGDGNYLTSDLHFLLDRQVWECVVYYQGNNNGSYYNVYDSNIGPAFGYVAGG